MRRSPPPIWLLVLLWVGAPLPALAAPPADAPVDHVGLPGPQGSPAVTGGLRVWAHLDEGALSTELRLAHRQPDGTWGPHRVLIGPQGMPDRPALSPDGRWVAFVWGITGVASVWILPVDAEPAADPKGSPIPPAARQLTNQGATTGQGRPAHFLPPPQPDTLRFEGDTLIWRSHEGSHAVRWR